MLCIFESFAYFGRPLRNADRLHHGLQLVRRWQIDREIVDCVVPVLWRGCGNAITHVGHLVASWWPDGVTGFVGPLQYGCVSVAMCWLFGLPLVSKWAGHVGRLCIVQSGCPSKATVQCFFFFGLGNFGRCLGGGDAVHF